MSTEGITYGIENYEPIERNTQMLKPLYAEITKTNKAKMNWSGNDYSAFDRRLKNKVAL